MNTIQLNSPVTVAFADRPSSSNNPEERDVTVTSLTLRRAIDDPAFKMVSVLFFETRYPLVVWEGDAYDEAGQWTDEQLEAAVAAEVAADPVGVVTKVMNPPARPSEEAMRARAERMKALFPNGRPRPAWLSSTKS
jgi:hypothetical protein